MIRRASEEIPLYGSREEHGLFMYFLAERYRSGYPGETDTDQIFMTYCEQSERWGDILPDPPDAYSDTPHNTCGICNGDDCVLPATRENALKYVSESSLEKFLSYHPEDQFAYVRSLYLYHERNRRDQDTYQCFVFCSRCQCVFILRGRNLDSFYTCKMGGCGTSYCDDCVEGSGSNGEVLSFLESSFAGYWWFYDCVCRKHDTLFDALYVTLFVDGHS